MSIVKEFTIETKLEVMKIDENTTTSSIYRFVEQLDGHPLMFSGPSESKEYIPGDFAIRGVVHRAGTTPSSAGRQLVYNGVFLVKYNNNIRVMTDFAFSNEFGVEFE